MKRPVKCRICKRQMYYCNDPKHEPEFSVDVHSYEHGCHMINHFFVHQSCWRKKFKERNEAQKA